MDDVAAAAAAAFVGDGEAHMSERNYSSLGLDFICRLNWPYPAALLSVTLRLAACTTRHPDARARMLGRGSSYATKE